jgi:hypothetical protein
MLRDNAATGYSLTFGPCVTAERARMTTHKIPNAMGK